MTIGIIFFSRLGLTSLSFTGVAESAPCIILSNSAALMRNSLEAGAEASGVVPVKAFLLWDIP
jgi:hypothetical protein